MLPEQASNSNSSHMTSRTSSQAGSVSSCISSTKPDGDKPSPSPTTAAESNGTATPITDDCSDCSSDVIIVEECEAVDTGRAGRATSRRQSSRVLRTRSLNTIQPARPAASTNSCLTRKNRRSTLVPSKRPLKTSIRETVEAATSQHDSTTTVRRSTSMDAKPSMFVDQTLLDSDTKWYKTVPRPGSVRLPRVHDLIDGAALAGATLFASGKQSLLLPQRANPVANGGAASGRRKG
ncbi:unnamed protein product, partial [Dibothriocephalus latus]